MKINNSKKVYLIITDSMDVDIVGEKEGVEMIKHYKSNGVNFYTDKCNLGTKYFAEFEDGNGCIVKLNSTQLSQLI